jgi:polysaccharide biosynthesis/export protein
MTNTPGGRGEVSMKKGHLIRAALFAAAVCIALAAVAAAQSDANNSQPQPQLYLIQPEDVLEIYVWPYPELSMKVTVRPDGMISYPFLGEGGEFMAAGKTVPEIAAEIKVRSEGYLMNPRISINVTNFRRKRAFVLGAVAHPGMIEIRQGDNIMDLITHAGGFTDKAKTSKVALIHPPKNPDEIISAEVPPANTKDKKGKDAKNEKEEQVPDNIILVDVANLLGKGQFPSQNNYELSDGDILFVPMGKKVDWAKLYSLVTTVYSAFRIDEYIK